MSKLSISNLSFSYDEDSSPAISNINLNITEGSINVIIGPSGCGKSTLCRCIAGIIPNAITGKLSGQVIYNNGGVSHNLLELKLSQIPEKVGLVMQEPDNQIVASTVEDDVAFGPENMCVDPAEIRNTVDSKIQEVGIKGYELNSPNKISGGEKQRTIIGGILALNPDVVIFDEPMSALDNEGKLKFINTVKTINQEGKTVVIIEHDFERLSFAHNWIIMKNGSILLEGSPDSIDRKLIEVDLWH